ncbi:MAG: PEP-CTERM sorting domain-containing protein [Pirellulales bacterium]|nr:PEP-CTERM sorting domain-containing protein [Pirellulales bacterium]
MSRISLLTLIGTLLLIPAVAQADTIPLLKNLTTGATVFHDDFEGDTIGAYPVADIGTWRVDACTGTAEIKVTDFANSGISAYQGSQFLKTATFVSGDDVKLRGVGAVDTDTTDIVEMQIAFHQVGGVMTGVYPYGGDLLLAVGLAADYSSWTSEIIYHDGSSWVGTGLTYAQSAWNTLKVTHTNGTTAWAISLNNGTPVNVSSFAAGSTDTWNEIEIKRGTGDVLNTYFDAVPEPGTMALLATGLIGLLCYAWRKRK